MSHSPNDNNGQDRLGPVARSFIWSSYMDTGAQVFWPTTGPHLVNGNSSKVVVLQYNLEATINSEIIVLLINCYIFWDSFLWLYSYNICSNGFRFNIQKSRFLLSETTKFLICCKIWLKDVCGNGDSGEKLAFQYKLNT